MIENRLEREFDAYSSWRQSLQTAVDTFRSWLKEQKISDIQTDQRLEQILSTLHDDKLYIAFVAEFSRGKSELINAIFFGGLGQRVLPSSAGRTTMCPTELMYDPDEEPFLKLLPIESRTSGTTIAEYKEYPEEWENIKLDPEDSEQLTTALHNLTEIKLVGRNEAREMGMPVSEDEAHQDGMHIRDDGLVEIPRWRHAIVNFPNALLEQGLVILDTPGLNALGAEPELTLNMLASAHAVMFILAADAGVTKSDMAVWRDHIATNKEGATKGKLIVLNKIDVLWDDLRNKEEMDMEIDRQIETTAKTLGVPESVIFPVSAQKSLLGKIKHDEELIKNSRIGELEGALANLLIPAKKDIVAENIRNDITDVAESMTAMLNQRLRDVDEHVSELDLLNSKNVEVIEDMMLKVRQDKEHLERNLQRFQATRSIFSQQTTKLYEYLSMQSLERQVAETRKDMAMTLTTNGLRSTMVKFFQGIRKNMEDVTRQANEIQALMEGVYKKFQEEHNLASIRPRRFSTSKYQRDLKRLEERHEHFLRGMSIILTEQMTVRRKFYDSVVGRVRQIFDRANRDADNWLKTIMSPMEAQVREHQVQLRRRLESIKRIHKASDTLDDRLAELRHVKEGMEAQTDIMANMITDVEAALVLDYPSDAQAIEQRA